MLDESTVHRAGGVEGVACIAPLCCFICGENERFFYRAMLCIRGTSHGPVSVSPSITSRSSTKTTKRRITQTTPHDSPGTLVF